MRIIEGTNVDLISPYPAAELDRAVQWFFQYSSYTGDDSSAKTPENIKQVLEQVLENHLTYGLIDKNNTTKNNHEAPLVGVISFAPQSQWNGYLHIATSRAAWGRKAGFSIAEESLKLVIADVWEQHPTVMRQSALMMAKNHPARKLAERCGLVVDGVFQNFFRIADKPADAIHLGILKTTKESLEDNGITISTADHGPRG
jgi:RimJ/RimL family protein N-acetyltransferase